MMEYTTSNDTITLKELRDFVNIACKEIDEDIPIISDGFFQEIKSIRYDEEREVITFDDNE